jgi:2-polyprenyl-3-methyl-5-hydroxy-6-metoxy-1,4-benzoquinol methylase
LNKVELYNKIYSLAIPDKGLYGYGGRRDNFFMQYIRVNIPKGYAVLDASCGRGLLIRWLRADGYIAHGTEIATWLLNPGGDLYGLSVKELSYEQLDTFDSDLYDVVISNDVLEHLDSEEDVKKAIENLVRISRKWFLMSTGGHKAAANPQRIDTGINNLHDVIKPKEWWKSLYEKLCIIEKEFEAAGSLFFFGTKK